MNNQFTPQTELQKRGYQMIVDPESYAKDIKTNDVAICRIPLNYEKPEIVARIKYSEVLQRNTAQEKLDFILSKLPNDTQ